MPGSCRIPSCRGSEPVASPILQPASLDELEEAIAEAVVGRRRLEVLGHGTKRGLGRPVEADARLDLRHLAGIGLYEPEELVLTAKPGTAMAEIEALIAQRGQMLACEPADLGPLYGAPAGMGTLGGMIACNLSGPRRPKAGAARDGFLGFTAVSGRGERFKAGGRVMKNVTGYDLPKLLAGSHGTLAALAEITVRVHPAPERTVTLLLLGLDAERGNRAMTLALGSAHDVSGAAYLPAALAARSRIDAVAGAGASVTALRLEGIAASVAARAAALERLLAEFRAPLARTEAEASIALWREIRDLHFLLPEGEAVIWRLSLPPVAGGATAERLARAIAGTRFYLDWGGGLLWAALPAAPDAHAAMLRPAAAAAGGHATLMRAPDAVRAAVPVFEPEPAPLAELTARVRAGFDPLGILNPGRMA
jgi:glycolate dehydrogenase FAD-binding subunit